MIIRDLLAEPLDGWGSSNPCVRYSLKVSEHGGHPTAELTLRFNEQGTLRAAPLGGYLILSDHWTRTPYL